MCINFRLETEVWLVIELWPPAKDWSTSVQQQEGGSSGGAQQGSKSIRLIDVGATQSEVCSLAFSVPMKKIPDDELSFLVPALMSVWLPGAKMSDTAFQSPVPWPLIEISSTRRPFRMETLTCHLFIRYPLRTNYKSPLRPFLLTLFFHSDFYNANSLIITWWVISSHLGFEDCSFIKKFLSATLPTPIFPSTDSKFAGGRVWEYKRAKKTKDIYIF